MKNLHVKQIIQPTLTTLQQVIKFVVLYLNKLKIVSFQDLVEDFIFPASKLIIDARNGNGKEFSFVPCFAFQSQLPVDRNWLWLESASIVTMQFLSLDDVWNKRVTAICSTQTTMVAAFDLLVALCRGCVQNLKVLADILTDFYYSGKNLLFFLPQSFFVCLCLCHK